MCAVELWCSITVLNNYSACLMRSISLRVRSINTFELFKFQKAGPTMELHFGFLFHQEKKIQISLSKSLKGSEYHYIQTRGNGSLPKVVRSILTTQGSNLKYYTVPICTGSLPTCVGFFLTCATLFPQEQAAFPCVRALSCPSPLGWGKNKIKTHQIHIRMGKTGITSISKS